MPSSQSLGSGVQGPALTQRIGLGNAHNQDLRADTPTEVENRGQQLKVRAVKLNLRHPGERPGARDSLRVKGEPRRWISSRVGRGPLCRSAPSSRGIIGCGVG